MQMSENERPLGDARFVARLPRFVVDQEIGSGDVVKKVTQFLGVRPCAPCERRAQRLNRLVAFEPRAERSAR
jgi:hypothetical protein